LIEDSFNKDEPHADNEETSLAAELPVRNYVIATHIYLELNNNELHYENSYTRYHCFKRIYYGKIQGWKIVGQDCQYEKLFLQENSRRTRSLWKNFILDALRYCSHLLLFPLQGFSGPALKHAC
jgi:hypothetical protein